MRPCPIRGRSALLLLVLCAVGCAPVRIPLRPSFWNEPHPQVGVLALELPMPMVYSSGDVSLVGVIADQIRFSDLEVFLKTQNVSRFGNVADQYVERLEDRGIHARKLAWTVDLLMLEPFTPSGPGEFAERDLRPLAAKEGIDTLIVLSVPQCGMRPPPAPFAERTAPLEAFCVGKGEMIDLRTNEVLWRTVPDEHTPMTVPLVGEWDEPPVYGNVTFAIDQAVTQAQSFLLEEFFGPRPRRR